MNKIENEGIHVTTINKYLYLNNLNISLRHTCEITQKKVTCGVNQQTSLRVNIIIHYGHDIQLLIVNCDIYGTDITTVKYLKLRKVIKITHDIIEIDSRHLILEF